MANRDWPWWSDDAFAALPSVTVLQLTSDIREEHLIRITVQPDEGSGLHKLSQVMIDRAVTIPRAKAGAVSGHVNPRTMKSVDDALGHFFGIGLR